MIWCVRVRNCNEVCLFVAKLKWVVSYVCAGSEDSRCCVFEKSFGKPVLEYKFSTGHHDQPLGHRHRPNYVSAVAWKHVSGCGPLWLLAHHLPQPSPSSRMLLYFLLATA